MPVAGLAKVLSGGKPDNSRPQYGLHTLVARDSLMTNVTDIVAVHGLNGHYEKTWTEELSQYNWLRDTFSTSSKSITARVMSFAYNSKVQKSKSTADIFDFADQLLECLLVERQTKVEQSRPIVFICHSLGGLVFKQAFNTAHGQSRYEGVVKKVIGALFFSTPHRGSAMASFASVLGNIATGLSFGSANTQLLRDLERNSYKLEQISVSFLQLAGHLRIISFYELDKTDYINSVIVDKDSAVMRMKNETTVPLDGDHRSICKFSSRSDMALGIILSNLAALIQQSTTSRIQTVEDKLLRELATSDPDIHKSRNPDPIPGTCTWILRHSTYKEWLQSQGSSLLWLSADPGCGKSVLATFLVDHLQKEQTASKEANVCYFFFKSDNDEQKDAVYGLQAILYQLLQSQPEILDKVSQRGMLKNIRSVPELWHTIVTVAQQPNSHDTICILDGFDECEPETRKSLTQLLSEFFVVSADKAAGFAKNKGLLKFIIFSRPENSLKLAFDRPRPEWKSCYSMIRLRGEDETGAVSHDIGLVIDAEISNIANYGFPEELLEDVRRELVIGADRTFLWVTLILQLLKNKMEVGASRRELNDILKNKSIYAIYAGLLSTCPDTLKARKLLSIILAATRPLSVAELSIALAVRPECGTFDQQHQRRRPGRYSMADIEDDLVYPFENYLKALCGNFIRIIRNHVYLVHETAREFLLERPDAEAGESEETWFTLEGHSQDQGELGDADNISQCDTVQSYDLSKSDIKTPATWQHSFSLMQCHATILEVCVTYIYCIGKKIGGFEVGKPTRRIAPFIDYAAVAWTSHFGQIRDKLLSSDFPYYQNLCHPCFPGFSTWIRVYKANEVDHCPVSIQSDDETQDYYVALFEMEFDPQVNSQGVKGASSSVLRGLSNNPTAVDNHKFPVTANANGWVSLNFTLPVSEGDEIFSNPWQI